MRILLANTTVSRESDCGPLKETVMPLWKKNFELVKHENTRITARYSEWGCEGIDGTFNEAIWFMNGNETFYGSLTAEKDGYDAILITCFDDPYLWQLRQIVRIPVIGLGETNMTVATTMGEKFGLVTFSDYNLYRCREQIARYGLREKCAGVAPLNLSEDVVFEGFKDANAVVEKFVETSRKLIAQGADVIIPGCGLISPILKFTPGMEKTLPNGLTHVDGVPIMDILSVGIKVAESVVELKQAGVPWISNVNKYELPTEKMLDSGRMCLNDSRQRFWDLEIC